MQTTKTSGTAINSAVSKLGWRKGASLAPPGGLPEANVVNTPKIRNTKMGGQVPATHGSLDNNIEILTETLERIPGSELVAPMEWLDY